MSYHPFVLHLKSGPSWAASTASPPVEPIGATLRLNLIVHTVAGEEPELDVTLETAPTPQGPWVELGTWDTVTEPGTYRKIFPGADRFVRSNGVPSAGSTWNYEIIGESL